MKKIFTTLLTTFTLAFSFMSFVNISHAETSTATGTVLVTEKIPGASCERKGTDTLYTCEVERGFGSIMSIMGNLIKYFTYIAGLCAVLALVVGGIMYSMGGADEDLKTKSKGFMIQALLGIIVLLLSGTILHTIAPWIFTR